MSVPLNILRNCISLNEVETHIVHLLVELGIRARFPSASSDKALLLGQRPSHSSVCKPWASHTAYRIFISASVILEPLESCKFKINMLPKNFSGVCKTTFNLNSVALILATMKRYRRDLHFLDIDAKIDMLEILACFRRGYLPGCPF